MGKIMDAFLKGVNLCLRQTDTPTYDKDYAAEVSLVAVIVVFLLEVVTILAAAAGLPWVAGLFHIAAIIVALTCAGLLSEM